MTRAIAAALTVLLCSTGCSGAGGTDRAASVSCDGTATCTVGYPAKARPNQSSSGGPPAQVFGHQTQLFSISGGQALLRIAEQPVTLTVGDKRRVGDIVAEAIEVTETLVVLRFVRQTG
ncbi:MAG: hypothetical protein ACT4QF_01780 [Sporichthyaceae bacterium]